MGNELIFAGLGNPGERYSRTRHNMGFLFCDTVQDSFDFPPFSYEKRFLGYVTAAHISGRKVYLIKPDTYMNRSGEAVGRFMSYYGQEPEQLFVIIDDMDIPFGQVRIRKIGGAGSHNGMKSVIGSLPSRDFRRIRLGIGEPDDNVPGRSWVLSSFSDREFNFLAGDGRSAWRSLFSTVIDDGVDIAMNKFNRRNND